MAFDIFFVEDDHKAQGCPRRTWADHVKRGVQAARNQQGIGVQRLHPQQKGPVPYYMLKTVTHGKLIALLEFFILQHVLLDNIQQNSLFVSLQNHR